jgi:hypothetical protein
MIPASPLLISLSLPPNPKIPHSLLPSSLFLSHYGDGEEPETRKIPNPSSPPTSHPRQLEAPQTSSSPSLFSFMIRIVYFLSYFFFLLNAGFTSDATLRSVVLPSSPLFNTLLLPTDNPRHHHRRVWPPKELSFFSSFLFFFILIPSGRIFLVLDFLFCYCFLRWDFGFVVVLHICLCS